MFNALDYVIDIETLGTVPGCAILSIGACPVLEEERSGFYAVISDPLEHGLSVSSDTFRWWLRQSEDARNALQAPACTLESSLTGLAVFLPSGCRVWSFGAGFDLPILHYAYSKFGLPVPWKHRNALCCRTLFALCPEVPRPAHAGVAHNALADAQRQAAWMRAIAEESSNV